MIAIDRLNHILSRINSTTLEAEIRVECAIKALGLARGYLTMKRYAIKYTRIPTHYNSPRAAIVEAESPEDALELLKHRLGDHSGVQGMSLSFQGWLYFGGKRLGGVLYNRFPDIIAKLHEFTVSPDPSMRDAAGRALLWIEHERILQGTPPSGPRTVPPQSDAVLGRKQSQRLTATYNQGIGHVV